jgi:hypothetical protein
MTCAARVADRVRQEAPKSNEWIPQVAPAVNKVATAAYIVLAQLILITLVAKPGSLTAQNANVGSVGSAEVPSTKTSADRTQLYAGIQDAIYKNRQQLLELFGDRISRSAVCTPAPNDSYDLFQASVQEKLDVLWDLDIYAAKYRLSKKQHDEVKKCAAEMEMYLDNFELWQQLNRLQENASAK